MRTTNDASATHITLEKSLPLGNVILCKKLIIGYKDANTGRWWADNGKFSHISDFHLSPAKLLSLIWYYNKIQADSQRWNLWCKRKVNSIINLIIWLYFNCQCSWLGNLLQFPYHLSLICFSDTEQRDEEDLNLYLKDNFNEWQLMPYGQIATGLPPLLS